MAGLNVGLQAARTLAPWSRRSIVMSWALSVLAVILWWSVLPGIDARDATDLGLVAVLPPLYFVALTLAVVAFLLAIHESPLPNAAVLASLLAMVVMTHGLRIFVADGSHLSVTWVHVAFADVITRTGDYLPGVDARFSWPLFFAFAALLGEATGLDLGGDLAPWVPLASNVLLLPCLLLIYRALTEDRRLVWLACLVFYATNWIGQDYFSPQAFALLIYLPIIGIVLTWFGARTRVAARAVPVAAVRLSSGLAESAMSGGQRAALVAVIVLLLAALIPSHQLTPFALLGSVGTLVLFRRTWLWGLPILVAVMIGTWVSYMTVPYLSGHIDGLLSEIGGAEEAAARNVGARLSGSLEHQIVVYTRLGATLVLWSLAVLGVFRRVRTGQWDVAAILLGGAPVALFFLQSYGGEMVQRIYLFSLPFVSFFVAALFLPRPGRVSRRTSLALAVVLAIMLMVFTVTRFGNERVDLMTAEEREAIDVLYEVAPIGSTLVAANTNSPLRYQYFEQYKHVFVGQAVRDGDIDTIVDVLAAPNEPAFLVITRGQQAWEELIRGLSSDAWASFEAELGRRRELETVYENRDAAVYRLRPDRAKP